MQKGGEGVLRAAYGRQVTSSRLGPPTHTTGVHRAWRRAPRSSTQSSARWPPARYEPHLDGLFTYCLSVLCDHDAATEALGGVLAVAERQDGRCPTGEEERKSWLYALARWMCLRKLAERRSAERKPVERKQGSREHGHRAGRPSTRGASGQGTKRVQTGPGGKPPSGTAPQGARAVRRTPPASGAQETRVTPGATPEDRPPAVSEAATEAHRRELARLVWPEAAGTTPEQREALELAVRHRLAPRAVASVLGLEPATARELLAAAACEVERTRAALAVLDSGTCPAAARLAVGSRVLLSAALRRELVRHVDDCPRCRRAAERVGAQGPWPGAPFTPAAALAVVEAPRPSAYVAMVHAQRRRSGGPRFDRAGFPMGPKDHAARRERMRARFVTSTVLATVVAAPVIALWTAYRGAPQTGEGHAGASVAATGTDLRDDHEGTADDRYENAGRARPGPGSGPEDGGGPDVSVEVVGPGPVRGGSGRVAVEARSSGGMTLIRLTATGSAPVAWSARANASWLRLSSSSGTLAEGRSTTVRVVVDPRQEPAGRWSAHIALAPWASAVAIRGHGTTARPPWTPRPSVQPPQSDAPGAPVPSASLTSSPDPTQSAGPTPDPTDSAPSASDPAPSPSDPVPSGSSTPTGQGTGTAAPPA
ncbi:hypothetical protein AB0L71_25640 [Streptomyces sp. NPDC052052]|uniref:BACON domain-containing protein n=1 Tax=Streptomyces sp. NPDC052052 TaxID=3154756 RepID=UPI003412364B